MENLSVNVGRVDGDSASAPKNLGYSRSGAHKFPSATNAEGCVVVPLALASCIPERAVLKFTANEAFTVKVNDGVGEYLVLYIMASIMGRV